MCLLSFVVTEELEMIQEMQESVNCVASRKYDAEVVVVRGLCMARK
jgi:hypothetical protein